ncbi:protein kinase domain-containing protein [Lederbergia panacisoli]|uniref:protein kinase domain-containing protein n=1 Tax=Lederbergia panacisoli TaxID=1255251 RepID=UPI00214B9759|nr:protein kinase family protein [Lederbergia panacisoli]MCR2823394.1 protein kinase family protein [Lederbergia panacisoli]
MMNNTWKNQCNYPAGTVITGKWHRHRYEIVRKLGSGANGVVYLARSSFGYIALKISMDSVSITTEVNVLKSLEKVQGSALGPSLYDVDDWDSGINRIHFYAMEYIQGRELLAFIKEKGLSWAGVMIVQLLDVLEDLHQKGWIFGDLKPENLIVAGPTPKIRCIDVGGTTMKGRAIKEFTEFFDRGYWGLGSRKAEPSYDLFSTAMLMINLYYPKRFVKKEESLKQLTAIIQGNKDLIKFESVLLKALLGKYQSAKDMKNELLVNLSAGERSDGQRTTRYAPRYKKKRMRSFLETVSILLITVILYTLYIFGYIL